MFLFSKSIILEDSESSRRDLSTAGVKTRFKAIQQKYLFVKELIFAPGGQDLAYKFILFRVFLDEYTNVIYDSGTEILFLQ